MTKIVVIDAVAEWLICETDSNGKAKDLICVSYEKDIWLMLSYSNAFVVGSSTIKNWM